MERIVIFGGNFHPSGLHHLTIARELRKYFAKVVIAPCGPRPEPGKKELNSIPSLNRAIMADLTFKDQGMEVDLSDLENSVFTPNIELAKRYQDLGEVWYAVGSDLVIGGARGESQIQTSWKCGQEVWRNFRFVVINADQNFNQADLPPQSQYIFMPKLRGRSTDIRRAVFERNPAFRSMVVPDVAEHIERYDLYRGLPARHSTQMILQPGDGYFTLFDWHNQRAEKLFFELELKSGLSDSKAIVAIGGDGFFLDAIKQKWRKRLPFIGINAGHRGFLLNDLDDNYRQKFKSGSEIAFNLFQMPMLHASYETMSGQFGDTLCFNDAWVERATSQAAYLKVTIDGRLVLPKLVADGILVATVAGSTAYARAMGAPAMRIDSSGMILVGNNVFHPMWKYSPLSTNSCVTILSDDSYDKRPIRGFADGQALANGEFLKWIQVRQSRIAAAELGYFPEHDLAEKISRLQFPF